MSHSLSDALQRALADALDVPVDDVTVAVTAPNWSDRSAQSATVRIEFDGEGAPLAQVEVDHDDETQGARPLEPSEASDADQPERSDAAGPEDDHEPDLASRQADDERDEVDGDGEVPRRGPTPEELDEEAERAADFLEGLLDAFDMPGDLRIRVLDDHAEVEIVEVDGGALIGRRGQTLEAIQELARCALQRQFERRTRVKVDIEGYRIRRLEKLEEKAVEVIEQVLDDGRAQRLEPMDVYERKAIHRLVAQHEGVSSHSQGQEPGRRIVIEPT